MVVVNLSGFFRVCSFICILLLILSVGCVAPKSGSNKHDTAKKPGEYIPPPVPDRKIINVKPGLKPSWLEKTGSFKDPADPGFRFFQGDRSGCKSIDEAMEAALADARYEAAAYMGIHVKSEFTDTVRERIKDKKHEYSEVIDSLTETTVNKLLERSEKAGDWWEMYNDNTFDGHALLKIPEENLDPLRSLARGLREAAIRAESAQKRLNFIECVLSINIRDCHALYVKAKAFESLGRRGDALHAFKELKRVNKGPTLDMDELYREIGTRSPYPPSTRINLDEEIFTLTPHWDEAMAELIKLESDRRNESLFSVTLNRTGFRRSDYGEFAEPVIARFACPEGRETFYSFFWIDEDGLAQANESAPGPDEVPSFPSSIQFSLGTCSGKVTLLFVASKSPEAVDFSMLDTTGYDGKGISKKKVETAKDRAETNRLYEFISLLKNKAEKHEELLFISRSFSQTP